MVTLIPCQFIFSIAWWTLDQRPKLPDGFTLVQKEGEFTTALSPDGIEYMVTTTELILYKTATQEDVERAGFKLGDRFIDTREGIIPLSE